jgi:hypothetical protein
MNHQNTRDPRQLSCRAPSMERRREAEERNQQPSDATVSKVQDYSFRNSQFLKNEK